MPTFRKKLKIYTGKLFVWVNRKKYLLIAFLNHHIKYRNSAYRLTILVPCYNNADTISRTLDSVLVQETNFKFKILIADDNSKDTTPDIIRNYQKKYPDMIVPILRENNLGLPHNHFDAAIHHIDTEYFAVLDADDYYTDNTKLQIQVDALDKHLGCSISSHHTEMVNEQSSETIAPYDREGIYNKPYYSHTSAKVVRSTYLDFIKHKHPVFIIDTSVSYMSLVCGKMYYFDRCMSHYHYNGSGIYSSLTKDAQNKRNMILSTLINHYSKGVYSIGMIDPELLKNNQLLKTIDIYKVF